MAIAALFLETLTSDPAYFVGVVVTVVVSITLHELGHVYAALRQGDETPRLTGHVTWNPLVHMGTTSLIFLLLTGIAWGQTPVNPSRFRGRHGAAIVSGAGPAVNLLLALVALTALGLWMRVGSAEDSTLARFLSVFGVMNLVLLILNLVPIPPLDGATVLAGASPSFARAVSDPARQSVFLVALLLVFVLGGPPIFRAAAAIAHRWVGLIA